MSASESDDWESASSEHSENDPAIVDADENSSGLMGGQSVDAQTKLKDMIRSQDTESAMATKAALPSTPKRLGPARETSERLTAHLESSKASLAASSVSGKSMRRAEQNRRAQKAYRKRKKAYMKALESELRLQRQLIKRLETEVEQSASLKKEMDSLQRESAWLKSCLRELAYRNSLLTSTTMLNSSCAALPAYSQTSTSPSLPVPQQQDMVLSNLPIFSSQTRAGNQQSPLYMAPMYANLCSPYPSVFMEASQSTPASMLMPSFSHLPMQPIATVDPKEPLLSDQYTAIAVAVDAPHSKDYTQTSAIELILPVLASTSPYPANLQGTPISSADITARQTSQHEEGLAQSTVSNEQPRSSSSSNPGMSNEPKRKARAERKGTYHCSFSWPSGEEHLTMDSSLSSSSMAFNNSLLSMGSEIDRHDHRNSQSGAINDNSSFFNFQEDTRL